MLDSLIAKAVIDSDKPKQAPPPPQEVQRQPQKEWLASWPFEAFKWMSSKLMSKVLPCKNNILNTLKPDLRSHGFN